MLVQIVELFKSVASADVQCQKEKLAETAPRLNQISPDSNSSNFLFVCFSNQINPQHFVKEVLLQGTLLKAESCEHQDCRITHPSYNAVTKQNTDLASFVNLTHASSC